MYNSLRGELTYKGPDKAYLLIGGVEWELQISVATLGQLPSTGEVVKLYTHLHHREDVMVLYGFYEARERALFLDLLRVNGVGPRAALKILSGIGVQEFGTALDREDVDRLTRIPGLGKKGAQKIILTLRGKLTHQDESAASVGDPGLQQYRDIVESLVNMGFDKKKTERVVRTIIENQDASVESMADGEILRRAIIELSQNP